MGLINLVSVYSMRVEDIADGRLVTKDNTISTNLTLSTADLQSIGGEKNKQNFIVNFAAPLQKVLSLLEYMTLVYSGYKRLRLG